MDQATKILDLCKKVGIKTAFELKEYKKEHNCKSNDDTIRALTETIGRVEKREKAIEEMINDICEDFTMTPPLIGTFCVIATSKGYRKEEEVQKETAREIVDWLNINTYTVAIYKKGLNAFLKERFGVEVEE